MKLRLMRTWVATAWLAGAASTTSSLRSTIINGRVLGAQSTYHEMFALPTAGEDSDDWLGCGASIISRTFAMTSAHCFGGGLEPCSGPTSIALWVGDIALVRGKVRENPGGRSFRVRAKLICHPEFDGKCSHGNDVALLQLEEELPQWITPMPLDLRADGGVAPGDALMPMGFGLTEVAGEPEEVSPVSSSTLRATNVTVLSRDSEDCKRVYAGGYGCSDADSEATATNLHMQLCAGSFDEPGRDSCSGDSGSPVVDANGVQVAIVSYGGGPGERMSGAGRICGDPRYPGVYARVAAFRDFLLQHVPDLPRLGLRAAVSRHRHI